jgi:hypothetical protein
VMEVADARDVAHNSGGVRAEDKRDAKNPAEGERILSERSIPFCNKSFRRKRMKPGKSILTIVALILGCVGLVTASFAASPATVNSSTNTASAANTKTKTHEIKGTVSSMSDTELVLSHTWKGKTESTKFVMNTSTKKDGTISKGEEVTVMYQYENKERTATEVKPEASKTTTSAKKS